MGVWRDGAVNKGLLPEVPPHTPSGHVKAECAVISLCNLSAGVGGQTSRSRGLSSQQAY